jgi:hypothetical protein
VRADREEICVEETESGSQEEGQREEEMSRFLPTRMAPKGYLRQIAFLLTWRSKTAAFNEPWYAVKSAKFRCAQNCFIR